MKVLVVDDERVARSRLIRMLKAVEDVTIVGEAADGEEALEKVVSLRPDVVLLDIQMPGLDGLSLATRLAELAELPHVIFVTAYQEYAVNAFEASAVDYLLKPVEAQRLQAALEKVRRLRSLEDRGPLERLLRQMLVEADLPRIVARRGHTLRVFDPREISRFHAQDGYTVFRQGNQEFALEESIASLERRLGSLGFMKAHRRELINLRHVSSVRREQGVTLVELSDGQRAVVSRRELHALKQRLGIPVK